MKKRAPRKPLPEPVVASAITHKTIGSGMTKRTRATCQLDSRASIEESQNFLRGSFFPDLADVLRGFLRDAKFPPPPPRKGAKFPVRSHMTANLAKQERASMPWYAAAILDELAKVDRHLSLAIGAAGKLARRSGQIEEARAEALIEKCRHHSLNTALAAYRAGTLNQEARGKFHFEETWTHGESFRSKQSNKGKARGIQLHHAAEKKWAPVRAEAEKIRGTKTISDRSLARVLKKKMKLEEPVETIRKQIGKNT